MLQKKATCVLNLITKNRQWKKNKTREVRRVIEKEGVGQKIESEERKLRVYITKAWIQSTFLSHNRRVHFLHQLFNHYIIKPTPSSSSFFFKPYFCFWSKMEKPSSSSSSTTYPNKATTVWDCGSTLYDSFELNSFKRHLDSAIANSARSLSMPHLSDRHIPLVAVPPPQPPPTTVSKKPFKIPRSLHKFLRSVFKLNNNHHHHHKHNDYNLYKSSSLNSTSTSFGMAHKSRDRYVVVYDKSGPMLSAIPELPEFEMAKVSPDLMGSIVKRSASERFRPTTIGISCA